MTDTANSRQAMPKKHNDPVLRRALQAMTLCGVLLGLVLYTWFAVQNEAADRRRGLADAAESGQIAAEAELARIEIAADRVAPLIAAALSEDVPSARARDIKTQVTNLLSNTPVIAVAALDPRGHVASVFGQMPSDVVGQLAPISSSRRAGAELVNLNLVPMSDHRAAYYRDVGLADGQHQTLVFVLRTGAFRAALDPGAGIGKEWRVALLNLDGDVVRSGAGTARTFTPEDTSLVTAASGWRPLHADEVRASYKSAYRSRSTLIETRNVDGGQMLLVYLAEAPSVLSVLGARRYEFLALFGASALALILGLSLIQNEWQREDRESEDAFLVLAHARASCDMLSAGVIDWSVADGRVIYSKGWAEMFAGGVKPASEDIYEWIARIHPDDQEAAREIYQAMLDDDKVDIEHSIRVRLPSGLWGPVLERGRAIGGEGGRPARIVLVQLPQAADGSQLQHMLDRHFLSQGRTTKVS